MKFKLWRLFATAYWSRRWLAERCFDWSQSNVSCKMSSLPAPERVRIFFTKIWIWTSFTGPFWPPLGPIDPSMPRQSEKCKKWIGYNDKFGLFQVCLSLIFEHVTVKDVLVKNFEVGSSHLSWLKKENSFSLKNHSFHSQSLKSFLSNIVRKSMSKM